MLQRIVAVSAIIAFASPASAQSDKDIAPVRRGEALVIGELHGTQEIPAYVAELVRAEARTNTVILGVEQREDTRDLPCSAPKTYPTSWQSTMQDGRTSTAMQDMLCKVLRLKTAHPIRVVYLDERSQAAPNLDQTAAAKFAAAFTDKSSVGLVLVGNYHSRNNPGSAAGILRSMGLTVVTATTSTAASRATAWQCRSNGCGVQSGAADMCSHTSLTAEWIKSPDPRWDYCLVLPTFTASPPASASSNKS